MPTSQQVRAHMIADPRGRGYVANSGNTDKLLSLINDPLPSGGSTKQRASMSGTEMLTCVDESHAEWTGADQSVRDMVLVFGASDRLTVPELGAWISARFPSGGPFRTALNAKLAVRYSDAEVEWGEGTVITRQQVQEAQKG